MRTSSSCSRIITSYNIILSSYCSRVLSANNIIVPSNNRWVSSTTRNCIRMSSNNRTIFTVYSVGIQTRNRSGHHATRDLEGILSTRNINPHYHITIRPTIVGNYDTLDSLYRVINIRRYIQLGVQYAYKRYTKYPKR